MVFTGIIETIGTIREVRSGIRSVTLGIAPEAPEFFLNVGGSLACDGVCLTLESAPGNVLYCTAVSETLDRTTIGLLRPGHRVNLERALAMNGRLDGHFVLGHVDCVGTIISDRTVGDSVVRRVRVPKDVSRFIAEKGSVAVDGISLTVSAVEDPDVFGISLIPFTFEKTTMLLKKTGDKVNIECDVIARYLARLMSDSPKDSPKDEASGSSLFDTMERLGY